MRNNPSIDLTAAYRAEEDWDWLPPDAEPALPLPDAVVCTEPGAALEEKPCK